MKICSMRKNCQDKSLVHYKGILNINDSFTRKLGFQVLVLVECAYLFIITEFRSLLYIV